MEGIHEILSAIFSSSEEDVLATIIHVEGSAYRKEGTSMLLRGDGSQIGLLSAGCLETDLQYRAKEIKGQKDSKTILYDMKDEDDLSWGQGAGCNGAIQVLLEPIDTCLREHLYKLKFHLESGQRVTVIKKLTENHSVTDYLFYADSHYLFGKWHGGISLTMERLISQIHLSSPSSGIHYFPEAAASLYIHSYEPKPRLLVFGAGPDAIPLVKIASLAGFSVIVSDWRSGLCKEEYFPNADQLIVGPPRDSISRLHINQHDSVLILTHHFQKDKEILQELKGMNLKYLGVLGPAQRTQRLLEGKPIPSRISSPVGITIGAEGAEEIAVSIVAELIQRQRSLKKKKVVS